MRSKSFGTRPRRTSIPRGTSLPCIGAIADKPGGMIRRYVRLILVLAACVTLGRLKAATPEFQLLYELIRTNVAGISAERLNTLAVEGLLERLGGAARFITNEEPAAVADGSLVKVNLFEGHYGYARIGEIGPSTAKELAGAISHWKPTNELEGVVLDLRFATGSDFQAAAQLADLFFPTGQPVLDWGEGLFQSTTKTGSFPVPVTVLVNRQTRGAPEAVAAALRSSGLALVIGGTTAGEAAVYRDFLLPTGGSIRIAVNNVKTGNGEAIPTEGLVPDIVVNTPVAWDRAYLADPFTGVTSTTNSPLATNLVVATVRVRKRINEAELVRSKQAGVEPTPETVKAASPEAPRIIRDPALARAVDLLKGLRIVRGDSTGK